MSAEFAALAASRLAPGGLWRLATDWADYAEQMVEVLDAEPLLENVTRVRRRAGTSGRSPGSSGEGLDAGRHDHRPDVPPRLSRSRRAASRASRSSSRRRRSATTAASNASGCCPAGGGGATCAQHLLGELRRRARRARPGQAGRPAEELADRERERRRAAARCRRPRPSPPAAAASAAGRSSRERGTARARRRCRRRSRRAACRAS